jgi:hypothetical protein
MQKQYQLMTSVVQQNKIKFNWRTNQIIQVDELKKK